MWKRMPITALSLIIVLGSITACGQKLDNHTSDCSDCIVDEPDPVVLLLIKGLQHLKKAEYKEALEQFNNILSESPKNPIVLYYIAATFSLMNDKEQSLDYLEQAVNNGFSDIKKIEEYSGFDNIRYEDKYKKIIAIIKPKE